jgi:hypothetical protein
VAAGTPQQGAGSPWLASSHAGSPPQAAPGPPPAPPGPPNPVAATAVDGQDRLTLQNNWFLIKGGDDFFLEHATSGLDIPARDMSISRPKQPKQQTILSSFRLRILYEDPKWHPTSPTTPSLPPPSTSAAATTNPNPSPLPSPLPRNPTNLRLTPNRRRRFPG